MTKENLIGTKPKTVVEFVVTHQEAMGLRFLSIVRAEVVNPKLKDESLFLPGLCRALTKWVSETADGRKSWKASCQDFNLGDLSSEDASERSSLSKYLAGEGIFDLKIETFGRGCRNWVHDTVLVNPDDLTGEALGDED